MSRIGLLSDSHGRAVTTRRGVAVLRALGADMLIHLGDVGSMEVIDALLVEISEVGRASALLPVHLVFGNVDWDAASMARYAQSLGMQVHHPVGELTLAGKTLRFMHGDDPQAMSRAMADGVDYLCHGHSHRMCDARSGKTRIINPGALFRASVYSVALLDSQNQTVTFHEISES